MIIRELFALLGFKTDDSGAKKFEDTLADLKKAAETAVVGVLAVGGAAAAAVLELAAFGGEAKDLSTILGTNVEALQELEYAAKLGGSSAEAMRASLSGLNATLGGTTEKAAKTRAMLTGLGVATRDGQGRIRETEGVLNDLADALVKIPDPAKRSAVASKILGDSGKALIPLLNQGAAGIEALRTEARELGAVVGEEVVGAADDLGDELDRLKVVGLGFSRTLGGALIPSISIVAKGVTAWTKENRVLIQVGIKEFAQDLVRVFGVLAKTSTELVAATVNVANAFGGLRNLAVVVALGWGILNITMLPTIITFGAVAAALLLVAAIVEDVSMFQRYGDEAETLTGRLKKLFLDQPFRPDDTFFVMLMKLLARVAKEAADAIDRLTLKASDFYDILSGSQMQRAAALERLSPKVTPESAIDNLPFSSITKPLNRAITNLVMRQPELQILSSLITPPTAPPVAPIVAPPTLIRVGAGGATTDARTIGPFYISTSDPQAAADAVVERMRDANTVQVPE